MEKQTFVEIELGGEPRRLALDLNASIALQELTGEDISDVLNRIVGGGEDKDGIEKLTSGEAAERRKLNSKRMLERVKAVRLITWALLASSCPEFENDPKSLALVGSWITLSKMTEIPIAINKLLMQVGGGAEFEGQLAPFVPTPAAVVERMIEMADVNALSKVVDLGAGDGRLMFVAAERGANAVGYEAHQERFLALQARIREHRLSHRMVVLPDDIRKANLAEAAVVFLYLLDSSNAELKAKLLAELPSGAKVISHDFGMPDWTPDRVEKVECEDRPHKVYLWTVPDRVAASV